MHSRGPFGSPPTSSSLAFSVYRASVIPPEPLLSSLGHVQLSFGALSFAGLSTPTRPDSSRSCDPGGALKRSCQPLLPAPPAPSSGPTPARRGRRHKRLRGGRASARTALRAGAAPGRRKGAKDSSTGLRRGCPGSDHPRRPCPPRSPRTVGLRPRLRREDLDHLSARVQELDGTKRSGWDEMCSGVAAPAPPATAIEMEPPRSP